MGMTTRRIVMGIDFRAAGVTRWTLLAAGCAVLSVPAFAQLPEEVTVQASRMVTSKIGRNPVSGAPINGLSLSYRVSYADLNLSTADGAAALEKRVAYAADAACRELSRISPLAKPDDRACAKEAREQAMVKVREAVAAAGQRGAG
jgi:UrcA family protein